MNQRDTDLLFELSMMSSFRPVTQERLIRDTTAIQHKEQERRIKIEQGAKDKARQAMLRNALFRASRSTDIDRLGPESL